MGFNLPQHIRARIDERSRKRLGTVVLHPNEPANAPAVVTPVPTISHDFESEEQARAEDRTRAKGLRLARPTVGRTNWANIGARVRLLEQMPFPMPVPPRQAIDLDQFLHRLEGDIEGVQSGSLGSSATMRTIRQTVHGAMVTAFEDYSDEALATVTVINRRWTFTSAALDGITAKKIKNRFRTDLNRTGILKMPGPFIAFLHGEFEPASGLYVLHFHILTTREKAEALKRLKRLNGYQPTDSGAAPVFPRRVRDRARQFSYLLKSYWPARTIRRINGAPKRDRGHHRIPEPFASQVLLWLDRQRLRDLTIMNDCWSMRSGGTETMKRLYLSVFGAW